MSSRSVYIHSTSLEVLFEGNLLKAPPLNRRGRKKWHERYFILRANRTIECHKSRKAAEAQKAPRRIVDLRECINLEIGLEYKNVQHIMSLGTFKRTFFYAAPSDPLMLLWADVLEKAKNAKDGDYIEVLDIGLRRTRDLHAVQNVRSSSHSPSRSSLTASPKRSPHGGAKNTMALSHFAHGSTETVDLRMFDRESESPASHSGGEGSANGSIHRYPSVSSTRSSSTVSHSPAGSPVRTLSGLLQSPKGTRKSQPNMHIQVHIPNKVPPPKNGPLALAQASRNKDGFFINQKKKDYQKYMEPDDSSDSEAPKEFVPKEGNLKRVQVIKGGHASPSKHGKKQKGLAVKINDSSLNPNDTRGGNNGPGVANFRSNMRRSFRYRKISLRTEFEKPLFETTREESESEDEDTNSFYRKSSVPGPQVDEDAQSKSQLQPSSLLNGYSQSADSLIEDDEEDPEFKKIAVVTRRLNSQQKTLSTLSQAGHSSANAYSKVTVMGARRNSSSSSSSGKRPTLPFRSSSQSDIRKHSVASHEGSHLPSPDTAHGLEDSLTVLPPPLFDALDLPPPGGDGLSMYGSQNSLDNILVEPPEMFNSAESSGHKFERSFSGSSHKRKLSRTKKIGSPVDVPVNGNGIVGNGDAPFSRKNSRNKKVPDIITENGDSIPSHQQSEAAPDRDSTESSDAGYTSSSPGYNTTEVSSKEPKSKMVFRHHDYLVFPEEDEDDDDIEDRHEGEDKGALESKSSLRPPQGREGLLSESAAFSGYGRLKSMPSVSSLASITSESSRCYVPLVFHSPRVEDAGANPDPNRFSVQVCLVENSDELIKDLVSVKTLESFSQVECDEIHGEANVAAAQMDDFTVETSLEDLEFGFSIIKSTQKDLFNRKVRQFTFQIKNLFGTSKPFSCDVEVRHGNQLTVLPIEVM